MKTTPSPTELTSSAIVLRERPRRTRKQIKADRLWRHWLSWMGEPFGPELKPISNYNPSRYRRAFEQFQAHGRKGLSAEDQYGIEPLLSAQKAKEVTLTSMAIESMEWWSKGHGWAIPWLDTLERVKGGEKMDRLTRVAILRTVESISKDPHGFFERHPGITPELKQRYFSYRVASLETESSRLAPLLTQNVSGPERGRTNQALAREVRRHAPAKPENNQNKTDMNTTIATPPVDQQRLCSSIRELWQPDVMTPKHWVWRGTPMMPATVLTISEVVRRASGRHGCGRLVRIGRRVDWLVWKRNSLNDLLTRGVGGCGVDGPGCANQCAERLGSDTRTQDVANTTDSPERLFASVLFAPCDGCVNTQTCKAIGCIAKELEETL